MEINKLGEKIRLRRTSLNLTLKDLSDKCGIMPQLISDYENGRKEPGIKNLLLISDSLGVEPNYLIRDSIDVIGIVPENSYGNVLNHYMEALKISVNDKMIVDQTNNKISIEINDTTLKQVLFQIDSLIKENPGIKETIINFNANILKNIEVKKEK